MPKTAFAKTQIKKTNNQFIPKPSKINPKGKFIEPLSMPNGMLALNSRAGIKVTKISISILYNISECL